MLSHQISGSYVQSQHRQFLTSPLPTPLATVLPLPGCSTFELFERLVADDPCPVLLESGQGAAGGQRYSIIASNPALIFRATGRSLQWHDRTGGQVRTDGDAILALRELLARVTIPPSPGLPPFVGGAIGYFGYDLVHWFESLPRHAVDDVRLPDLELGCFDAAAVIDHQEHRLWLFFTPFTERFVKEPRRMLYEEGCKRLAVLEARATHPAQKAARVHAADVPCIQPGQSPEEYLSRVRRCLEYIRAGDIYQANLSHRFSVELAGRSPRSVYAEIRRINPSPFAALLELPDVSLVSCSPERLVRVADGEIETRPLAGTRPRGGTPEEDARLVHELVLNEKERAEHLMLVDLERNDLGRVCRYGSVHVTDFMTVERYSHVSHIVSNVCGQMAPGRDAIDVLQALFPGGTVTGVPKVRCLQILDELEPVRRGPYTGALGYVSASGQLDLSIVIRTLVITGERAYLQVGAGIVADSDPGREYEETLYKAEALLRALQET
jgi:anthranilate/para-aminobenzoate synthase component I